MKIEGKLSAVGRIDDHSEALFAVIVCADGREITITGLSKNELAGIAPFWGDEVTLSVELESGQSSPGLTP